MRKLSVLNLLLIAAVAFCFIGGCTGQEGEVNQTPAAQQTVDKTTETSLFVYCGAGLRAPMDEIADVYNKQTGTEIEYTYGGSAQLLSQIEIAQTGDLYMPGSTSYIESAAEKGFVNDTRDVVYHIPAIITPKGNPANITSLNDLTNEGVKVALGDPAGPAIGKMAKKILEKNGVYEEVLPNVIVTTATSNELITYVRMSQVDAIIEWEDQYVPESMEKVTIPKENNIIKLVPIGVLTFSEKEDEASKFMEFVASEDGGKSIYAKHGFEVYEQ